MKRWEVLHEIIATKNFKLGVELGVHQGQTLFYLLDKNPYLHMTGVDHWKPRERMDQELNYKTVIDKAETYGGRCNIFRADTARTANRFEDELIDFVFVDADHSYEACKRDIVTWLPKIRSGGVMAGHDINLVSVKQAVTEVFGNKWFPYPEKIWFWQHL